MLYGLTVEESSVPEQIRMLHDYVGVHNECVRTGDWEPLCDWFAKDAELAFGGVQVGPFRGVEAIGAAYEHQPPDDQVLTFSVDEQDEAAIALYGWLRRPAVVAGRMLLTPAGERIGKLLVTFEEGLTWS